jgi:enoyl-CoA hydratase
VPVLLFERRGPVALVTLNRPEARNAVNPELAVRMTCASMNPPEPEALALERTFGRSVFETEDAREGPRAFQEKRKPRFTGR